MATGEANFGSALIEEGGASTAPAPTFIRLYKETGAEKLLMRTATSVYDVQTSADFATAAQAEALTTEKVITTDTLTGLSAFRHAYGGRVAALYDFSVHTGGTGTYNLIRPAGAIGDVMWIPNKSRITNAYLYVVTAAASAGAATIALGVATDHAAGLRAAAAYTDFSAAAWIQLIPDTAVANFTTITTAQRNLILTIAAASLTAGKFIVYADYVTTP